MKKLYEEPTLDLVRLLLDSELLAGSVVGGEGDVGDLGGGGGDTDDPLA